jgi:hypothetical protein
MKPGYPLMDLNPEATLKLFELLKNLPDYP